MTDFEGLKDLFAMLKVKHTFLNIGLILQGGA